MIRAVDEWCAQQQSDFAVFGQIGSLPSDGFRPKHFEWVERLPPEEFNAKFSEATVIVSHAGMGSIISALQNGKQIVVMPRLSSLREHRNDHQLATVGKMATRPGVHVAKDESQLSDCLNQAIAAASDSSAPSIDDFADDDFTSALRTYILTGRR